MTCKDVSAMLDRLLDGELTEEERRELEAHGRECPDCAAEIRSAFQMKALFEDTLPEVDVPLEAQAKWRGAVREAAKQDKKRRITRWIGSAAAAVVVLVGVGVALNGSMAPKQNAAEPMAVVQEAAKADAADEASGAEYADEAVNMAPVIETDGESAEEFDMAAGAYDAKSLQSDAMPVEAAEAAEEAPRMFESEAADEAPMCAALAQQSPACEYAIQARDVQVACGVIRDLAGEFEGYADVQDVEGGSANVYVELDAGYAGEFLSAVAKLDDGQNPADPPEVSGEGTVLVLLVVGPVEE